MTWSLLRSWPFWLLVTLAFACFAGPRLLALDPEAIDLTRKFRPPSASAPLGTDENGRDLLARVLAGGQVSLFIGFGAGMLAGVLGAVVGLLAAALGGVAGAALMRFTDLAMAFPGIFVLLLLAALLGRGVPQLVFLIGVTLWTAAARLVRARALELLAAGYVEAAVALGASPARVLLRHVLPNLRETIAVALVLAINHAIQSESTVSFLGLGIRPPLASWGTLLTNAQAYIGRNVWMAVAPGAAIALTVLATHALASRLAAPHRPRQRAAPAAQPTPHAVIAEDARRP